MFGIGMNWEKCACFHKPNLLPEISKWSSGKKNLLKKKGLRPEC
ncbi:hypothetical protein X842_1302 [Listeria monocytogenes Lm_1880]|nr:hypothetical protein X842_1302 [Listeria monocytogenes Lm_1880]